MADPYVDALATEWIGSQQGTVKYNLRFTCHRIEPDGSEKQVGGQMEFLDADYASMVAVKRGLGEVWNQYIEELSNSIAGDRAGGNAFVIRGNEVGNG